MPGGLWHIHRGKPNILAYHHDRPTLIDSGCVNYDKNAEREGYLKTRAAHNVIVVEPVEKDEFPGNKTAYAIKNFHAAADGGSVTAICAYGGVRKYTWVRTVKLNGDILEIKDDITATKPIRCALHFHTNHCRIQIHRDGIDAYGDVWSFACRCKDARGLALQPSVAQKLAVDDANKQFMAPDVSFKQTGRKVSFRTTVRFEQN
jgi:hypothetical protein